MTKVINKAKNILLSAVIISGVLIQTNVLAFDALSRDRTPPIITIVGNNPMTITVGEMYVDAGATAADNIDGDLTPSIRTINTVNTKHTGSYIVVYRVADKSRNLATAIRRVSVVSAALAPDITAPSVKITNPVSNTTVSGTIIVKGISQDPNVAGYRTSGVKQMQFFIDGSAVGNPATSQPYSTNFDTTGFSDGSHLIGAVAFDNSGNQSAMATISVIFSNKIENPDEGNLILNPSLEVGIDNPNNWQSASWGNNNANFSYPVLGHIKKAASVSITNYKDGDAKWYFGDVKITPGEQYIFSDFYKSTVPTRVTARFALSDNSFMYYDFGYPSASLNWNKFTYSFTAPINAVSLTVFHLLTAAGSLSVDDYYLGPTTAGQNLPFGQAMVSLNFDDGWESAFQNGIPMLNNANLKSTQYIISGEVGDAGNGYISQSEILSMQKQGHEIGSHSVTHQDLTTLSSPQAQKEIVGSKSVLEGMGINTITSFAYPFGAWNSAVEGLVKNVGYLGARTAGNYPEDFGVNYANTDKYALKTQVLTKATTLSNVQQWINDAISKKAWLILVFHQIDDSGSQYSTAPSNLGQIINYLKANNVKVVTNSEGLAQMK
jgi:peptidoglycan/xylan/chitin deacetylase (PgdA/CDA1 family)